MSRNPASAAMLTQERPKGSKPVLFVLDEVDLLGYMSALEEARDRGRKYGISLMLLRPFARKSGVVKKSDEPQPDHDDEPEPDADQDFAATTTSEARAARSAMATSVPQPTLTGSTSE